MDVRSYDAGGNGMRGHYRFVIKTYAKKQTMENVMNLERFYRSSAWKHKRVAILKRDKYQCRECRRYGRITEATTVHHIKHLDDCPELALTDSNLVSLCAVCHDKAHPEKAAARNKAGTACYYG